jgi:hypothetical protein
MRAALRPHRPSTGEMTTFFHMPNARTTASFDMPLRTRPSARGGARAQTPARPKLGFGLRTQVRAARIPRVSPVALSVAVVATLAVAYIALIAVVMSYAALTVSLSQSVRSAQADIAALESDYFDELSRVAEIDYAVLGYEKPATQTYVPTARVTALR